MSEQITITVSIGTLFERSKFDQLMERNNATKKETKSEYEIAKWSIDGINITLYEKKLVIQCKKDETYYDLIKSICDLEGLTIDKENRNKLLSILPKHHNVLLCKNCNAQSRTITAEKHGMEIKFKQSCSHLEDLNSPILMLNNRILPDLNILISNSLSRLIELGHFEGYEVVIPKFIMKLAETLGGSKKTGIVNEISKLKELETQGKIKIFNFADEMDPQMSEEILKEEDIKLAKISDLTNSILVTADNLFRGNRELENRPVILIPGKILDDIKTIHDTRS
jgi:hypothetical protein